jgi:hypothetical protein
MIIRNFREISPKVVLGMLNSKLVTYWFVNTFDKFQRKTFPQFKVNELATFPILNLLESEQTRVQKVVESILEAEDHLSTVPKGSARHNEIVKHLSNLNTDLDHMLYEIVGLDTSEIEIVESLK